MKTIIAGLTVALLASACSSHHNLATQNPFNEIPQMSFSETENLAPHEFRLVFQGNIKSELGTCGCAFNPTGGIDRKLNFLKSLKGNYLYLDSGNNFFSSLQLERKDIPKLVERAKVLAKAHVRLGVGLQNVGRYDLAAGLETLIMISQEAKLSLISSNIVDANDDFIFLPFKNFVLDNGLNVSVLGFSNPASEDVSQEGFKVENPVEKLKLILKKIPQDHILVILSDMTALENQNLSSLIYRPHIVVGSSGFESYKIPLHQNMGIHVQGLPLGQELNVLELQWKSDAETWFNQGAKDIFAARYEDLKKERKYFEEFPNSEEKSKEIEKNEADLTTLLRLLPPRGSSFIPYRVKMVSMDSSWSAPNEFTKTIKKWK